MYSYWLSVEQLAGGHRPAAAQHDAGGAEAQDHQSPGGGLRNRAIAVHHRVGERLRERRRQEWRLARTRHDELNLHHTAVPKNVSVVEVSEREDDAPRIEVRRIARPEHEEAVVVELALEQAHEGLVRIGDQAGDAHPAERAARFDTQHVIRVRVRGVVFEKGVERVGHPEREVDARQALKPDELGSARGRRDKTECRERRHSQAEDTKLHVSAPRS